MPKSLSRAAGSKAITEADANSPLVGTHVCKGMAPAFVMAATIRSKNAIIEIVEFVARLIFDIKNVPEIDHIKNTPSIKAASDAPIIAKLFVAAKFELLPPVDINRYSETVTISQNIRRKSKWFESNIPAEPPIVSKIEP